MHKLKNMIFSRWQQKLPSFQDLFEQWKEIDREEKRKKFIEFINEKVNINKVDESMLITAIMAPPAAMMAKKTGQIVPQLALMNAIPDVVFVPSATLLALIAVKIIRLPFIGKTTSKNIVSSTTVIEEQPQITPEQQPQTETTPETEVEEPQTETTPESEVEEPQTPTTQPEMEEEPQVETRQEPPTATISEAKMEEEPQTTTTPETLKDEPQIESKPEALSTMTPETEIEKEPQSQTTTAPETTVQGPQIPVQPKPHFITGHVHKDNTTCFLCNEYHIYWVTFKYLFLNKHTHICQSLCSFDYD